jgi:hypothetical protein
MSELEARAMPARGSNRDAATTGGSRKLLLLAGAAFRSGGRWARQHLYVLLLLTPMVAGMTYMTAGRLLGDLSRVSIPPVAQALLGAVFTLGVLILDLSGASRKLYHLRQPATVAESLPVSASTHLSLTLLSQLGRALLFGLLLGGLRSVLRPDEGVAAAPLLALGLFVVLLAQTEVCVALHWIDWSGTGRRGVAARLLLVALASSAVGGLLLTHFFNPAAYGGLASGLGMDDGTESATRFVLLAYAVASLLTAALYWLTRRFHERWRATDIDYAQRLGMTGRGGGRISALTGRFMPPGVASMLARDLRLTLRLFSSAVYAAAGVCVALALLLLFVLTGRVLPQHGALMPGMEGAGWLSATWLPAVVSIKLACALGMVAAAALLPMLVQHQLQHLWLERAVGVKGAELLYVKLWFTRLITFPVMLLLYVLGVTADRLSGGGVPLSYVLPLLAECVWLWWVVSSFVGAIAFEMPERTGLAFVLAVTIGLATGGLTAAVWVMGVAIYGMGMTQVLGRGCARASYYLLTGGE